MTKPVDIEQIISILKKHVVDFDVPVVDLINIQTKDPFKVLIATILSARTKDEVTAKVCGRLFEKITAPDDFKQLSEQRIEKLIYPVGFYKTKAKHLKLLPSVLDAEFAGVIPSTVDELVKLPGVGRKTANLVVAVAFSKPAICVDIHVHRINNRLGYVKTTTPFETEMELRAKLPKKHWKTYNSVFVAFGQHLCRPVSPKCSVCPIAEYCNKVGVTTTR